MKEYIAKARKARWLCFASFVRCGEAVYFRQQKKPQGRGPLLR